MKRIGRFCAVTVAGLMATLGLAGAANATAVVSCGDVITGDTVLTADVGPCTGDGIVVGADHITLDLNGHTVFGATSPADNVGILIERHEGVQVLNGEVHSFGAGVVIDKGGQNTVRDVTAHDNIGSGQSDFGDGIVVFNSHRNVIVSNDVVHNGPFSGISVVGVSNGNRVESNRVQDNNIDRFSAGHGTHINDDIGIRLEFSSHNVVANNRVSGSGLDGITAFFKSQLNQIVGNEVTDNGFHTELHRRGDGIRLFLKANSTLVEGNTVLRNAANGIAVGSRNNDIVDNTSLSNAAVVPAFDLADFLVDCDNNSWVGNTYGTVNQSCAGS